MLKNIFITGGTGFIGQNLIKLLRENDYDVTVYSRSKSKETNINMIHGDILEYERLQAAMKGSEAVIHLAAVTPYKEFQTNLVYCTELYIQGTYNVLKAANINEIDTIILPSSGKVYGFSGGEPISENMLTSPRNHMGKLKLELERLISLFCDLSLIKRSVILRIFNVYGSGQSKEFLIPKIISKLGNGEINLGDTSIIRDYVHVQDVAKAILVALEKAPDGITAYNIGSGNPISIDEILNRISVISGINMNVIFDCKQVRGEECPIEYADISKIMKLGWAPEVDFDVGLKALIKEEYSHALYL